MRVNILVHSSFWSAMAIVGDRWLTLPSINTLSSDESCGGWYSGPHTTLNEAAAARRPSDRGIMANPVYCYYYVDLGIELTPVHLVLIIPWD